MAVPKFSKALFRTIVFLSILPMLVVVVFFAQQFYNSTIEQAQNALIWRVKNDAVAVRQLLYKATVENERMANSKAIAQLPVRILYSQFALTQLQAYVKSNHTLKAAMVLDNDGFIVEGFPLQALNLQLSVTKPIVEAVSAAQTSTYFLLSIPELSGSDKASTFFLATASLLSLEQSSLSTPFTNTGVLLTLQPMEQLLDALADIEQQAAPTGDRDYLIKFADQEFMLHGEAQGANTISAQSAVVDVHYNDDVIYLQLQIREAQAPHLNALKHSLVFSGLLLFSLGLMSALLARWLVRKLNQPLQDIAALSQEYAKGNYESNVRRFSYSEFQNLSESLQSMAITIEQQIESLREQKQRAEASERAKSAFLANMSHEIRTPMNGIFGYLQLLQSSSLEPKQSDYTRQIRLCTEMLLTVINDVLDFSKIEANKVILEERPCNVQLVVKDVMSLFEPTCQSKGIGYSVDVDNGAPVFVLCDEIRVKQVLINLMSNAVKFTNEGQVEIGLTYDISGQLCTCQFYVKDSGVGIAKDKQALLFQPFVQAQDSTTREYGGTGLGLTICKRLVELMGGSISLESEPDNGSCFTIEITFPVSEGAPAPLDLSTDVNALEQLRGAQVLVAEDNPINQCVIKQFLEDLGIEVTLVENGQQAVESQGNQHFDLILMDIQMPVMDGLSAARAIAQQDSKHPPIIAVSANAMSQNVEEALQAGMQDHLAKPIQHPDLVAMLAKWLAAK